MRKIAILLATFLLAGCFHEIHELNSLNGGEGLLGTFLRWELDEDAGTDIHSLSISAGGSATPFTKTYKNAKEAAHELIPVPSGKLDVLATVNMTGADGFVINGLPATKADIVVGDVVVSLKNPVSSPAQAWYGVSTADIKDKGISIIEPKLQRLLSTLTVSLANVPAGTKLTLTLSNVASAVNLTAKDANGRFGRPVSESVGDLLIASLTAAADGKLSVDGFTMLPTASAFERCILTIDVTSASGHKTQCICDAPHMESGKGYSLDLDYSALRPFMYLDSYSISAWEDGWTVNGEILNPKE